MLSLGFNDDLFKIDNKSQSMWEDINITSTQSKKDFSNFKLNNIVCYEDAHTNDFLLYEIKSQISNKNKNINFDYLGEDPNFTYKVIKSDGSEFDKTNIKQESNKNAADGKTEVQFSFKNDLYIKDFSKTFTINLSSKKYSLNSFNDFDISFMFESYKLNDILNEFYFILCSYCNKGIDGLKLDDNINVNFTLITENNKKIYFNKNSSQKILSQLAISGYLGVNLNVNNNSKIFYGIDKTFFITLNSPINSK